MELQKSNSWYEKKWLVVVLCIVFFPIGLFALWKNSSISKGWKIGVTIFFSLIVILNMGGNKSEIENSEKEFDLVKERKSVLAKLSMDYEKMIKSNLKDPNSFELISRNHSFKNDNDSIYEISIVYSGTNSYGGRIQNTFYRKGKISFKAKDSTFYDIPEVQTNN